MKIILDVKPGKNKRSKTEVRSSHLFFKAPIRHRGKQSYLMISSRLNFLCCQVLECTNVVVVILQWDTIITWPAFIWTSGACTVESLVFIFIAFQVIFLAAPAASAESLRRSAIFNRNGNLETCRMVLGESWSNHVKSWAVFVDMVYFLVWQLRKLNNHQKCGFTSTTFKTWLQYVSMLDHSTPHKIATTHMGAYCMDIPPIPNSSLCANVAEREICHDVLGDCSFT